MRFVSSMIVGALAGLIGPSAASLMPGSSLSSTFTFLVAAPVTLPLIGSLVYFGSSFVIDEEEDVSMRMRTARSGIVMLGLFLGLVGVLLFRIVLGGQ